MTAAKLVPGVIKCNFESGGDVINTVPIVSTAARTFGYAIDTSGSYNQALGTSDFVVLLHCCPYSMFYGAGGINEFPYDTKMGGLAIMQTNNV